MESNNNIRPKYDRKCVVCGESAHFLSSESDSICLRVECKHVLAKRQHLSEKAFKQYFTLQSRQIKWNIRRSALKKQMLEEQRKKEEKEYVDFLMSAIKDVHGSDPTIYPYTLIPKNTRRTDKLPQRRKNLFREFLSALINEAFVQLEGNKDNNKVAFFRPEAIEDAYPIEAKACAVCRGVCCNTGGKDAYIKKDTIHRYMSGNPGQKPGDVLAAYIEHLAEKTYLNSCVYHTETGCNLPRIMRSDTCNEFLCDSLIELDGLLNKAPIPKGVFLIEYAKENWREDNLDRDDIVTLLALKGGEIFVQKSLQPF
jgi:hypothetical protein